MKGPHFVPVTPFIGFEIDNIEDRGQVDTFRMIESNSDIVLIDTDQMNGILHSYFSRLGELEISSLAVRMAESPDKLHVWMMASQNLKSLAEKFAKISGQVFGRGLVRIEDNYIYLDMEYDIRDAEAQSFSIINIALEISYSLFDRECMIVSLRPGFEWVGRELENREINVLYGKALNSISIYGSNICLQGLRTSNGYIERALSLKNDYPVLPRMDDFIFLARHYVSLNIGNPEFDVEALAKLLCLSSRTLQRKLANHGVSFTRLKEAERIRLLSECVSKGLTREKISEILGFGDIGALSKFLSKQRSGSTPFPRMVIKRP